MSAALQTAFRTALLHQGTLVFLLFVLLAIAWVACREMLMARARPRLVTRLAIARAARQAEPAARRVLRIGFGLLWILDGLLQAQPDMAGGLPSGVTEPAAAGSPRWVVDLVTWAGTGWARHPVQAAAAAVWIQLGIGILLVTTSSARWSRVAGLVSAGWGAAVWVFGEALGSMLAPGQSWLTGAPGAALFYCAAGSLLALPLAAWRGPRLGRLVLRAGGALLIAYALLQAWPGRGSWQGRLHGRPGPLASAISGMAATRQPAVLHEALSSFSSLVAGHGFAVNLAVVAVLAATGLCLLSGRPAVMRPAAVTAVAVCLAVWVLVQDLGFLGGLGTDPNSMIPQALLLACGLVAVSARPAAEASAAVESPAALTAAEPAAAALSAAEPAAAALSAAEPAAAQCAAAQSAAALSAAEPTAAQSAAGSPITRSGAEPRTLPVLQPAASLRGLGVALGSAGTSMVFTLWAVAIVMLGVAPMALAMAR